MCAAIASSLESGRTPKRGRRSVSLGLASDSRVMRRNPAPAGKFVA
jgi:hypothetical protein